MTNAEKLAKDTEQLADIISEMASPCKYCIHNYDGTCGPVLFSCFGGIKKWLEQEVKEDD